MTIVSASVSERRAATKRAAQWQPRQIDYAARACFLPAANDVMQPSPIDSLRDVVPGFLSWVTKFWNEKFGPLQLLFPVRGNSGQMRKCSLAGLEAQQTSEACALKNALEGWMERYHFRDQWIADHAMSTMLAFFFVHVISKQPWTKQWTVFPVEQETRPGAKVDPLQWRGGESLEEYCDRFDAWYRESRKQFVKSMQARLGERANQEMPARMTAARFAGFTYAQIADQYGQGDANTARKAVVSFSKRAGLTLVETLTGSPGKGGKTKVRP